MTSHAASVTARERLIAVIAGLLDGCGHIAVGASSPIPAAGAMLLRALRERETAADTAPVRLSILGSVAHNFFTNGGVELFDCAAQGRIDAFFLGGGQIDGAGNINLVGTGAYPATTVRWPGSFGSSYLYFVVPRVILFREEHSRRVMVERVDFISAPGVSEPGVHRTGGPHTLLTSMALFDFDKAQRRFRLVSVHPGHSLSEVEAATGFAFERADAVAVTPDPDAGTLALIRGRVLGELSETYPDFAAALRAEITDAA